MQFAVSYTDDSNPFNVKHLSFLVRADSLEDALAEARIRQAKDPSPAGLTITGVSLYRN